MVGVLIILLALALMVVFGLLRFLGDVVGLFFKLVIGFPLFIIGLVWLMSILF